MPTLAAPLDLAKLEARNLRAHQLTTAPSSPVTGQMYYNTTDNTLYWWNGTAWQSATGGGAPEVWSGINAPAPIATYLMWIDTDDPAPALIIPSATPTTLGAIQLAGDLAGSAVSPQIAAGVITDADVNISNKDGPVGVPGMRTLGSGNQQAMAGNQTLNLISAPIGSVNLNSQKIIGLATPTSGTDAATKAYVDAAAQGLDVKASCRAASTANIALTVPGTVCDGLAMVNGDRVLLKNQTLAQENGIYVWGATLVRSTDADISSDVTPGMFTFIEEGTINADSGWILTTNAPITLDTTGLAFSQFSGAGQITAGAGLIKTGNQLDVVGTASRISVAADSIDIDAAYVGQASITTLGTVATGTWNATPIAVAKGGTGQTTAKAAREIGLGAAGYYSSATHSAGVTITILQTTHLLQSTRGLLVQCQIDATGAVILPDISVAANGDVAVTFAVSQTANTIRTTIIG